MQNSPRSRKTPVINGLLFILIGLALTAGGAWLIALGGSFFYAIAGLGIILTGGLLMARRRSALWLYALVVIGSVAWSISDIRFDWWPLAARLDVIFPLGLWLLTPWVTRGLGHDAKVGGASTLPLWIASLVSVIVLGIGLGSDYHDINGSMPAAVAGVAAPSNDEAQPDEDWRDYGRSQFGQRYSPLKQITPANVKHLKVAWTFRTGDLPGKNDPVETTFEVTPIKVRDTVYLCSQHQRLFALDAKTGTLRWSYDPKVQDNPTFQHLTCRGVSYHETAAGALNADGTPAPTDCPRTIFLPVNDGRMIALNADSGKPCESFGDHGTLSLE
jgi:quinoprotein glucose dehydrogenase